MHCDEDDLVCISEDQGMPNQRSHIISSEDIRAMIDAALDSPSPSVSEERTCDLRSEEMEDRHGEDRILPPVPQESNCVGDSIIAEPPDSSLRTTDVLSGLGGLGVSEAVDDAIKSGDSEIRDEAGEVVSERDETPSVKVYSANRGGSGPRRPASEDGSTGSCPRWSELLRSPSKGKIFSPSRDINKSGSLHGYGLIVAVNRAKSLSRCGKRCTNLLSDVASLHDVFAQSIETSCHTLGGAANDLNVFPAHLSAQLTELMRALISFSKQMQGLSICMKGSVARPLHGSASALADTVPNIYNRYALTRTRAFNARNNAIRMSFKYTKAVREAESAIHGLKKANATEEATEGGSTGDKGGGLSVSQSNATFEIFEDSNHSQAMCNPSQVSPLNVEKNHGRANTRRTEIKSGWEDIKSKFEKKNSKHDLSKSSEKVLKALDDVQAFEAQYCTLVDEENHAVSRSQTMEIMALEALQKLEEERLQFFIETLGRALQAEKGALDNMVLILRKNSEDSNISKASSNASQSAVAPLPLAPSSLFTKRKAASTQSEEGSSANEVLALNLPEDLGRWRDIQKRNLSAQYNRTRAIKSFSVFFNGVASASLSFGSSLAARLANDGYGTKSKTKTSDAISLALNGLPHKSKSSEFLAVAMHEFEGQRALSCWNKVVESLADCSKSASKLGASVQKDGRELQHKYLSTEKELKNATESEDARWNLCCDAAKEETKTRIRLEQSLSDHEKALQRLNSVEEGIHGNRQESGSTSLSNKHSAMTKALGNMFSMLPEEAMTKMLTPDQRLAIVKQNLKEADIKQKKEKAAYDATQAFREKSVASYLSAAQADDNQSSARAEIVWSAINAGMEVILSSFHRFRESRYDSVGPSTSWLQEKGAFILDDLSEWTNCMQETIAKYAEKEDDELRTPGSTFRKRKQKGLIGKANDGFSLQVQLEDSKGAYKLLELATSDVDDTDAESDNKSEFGGLDEVEVDSESVAESESTELDGKSASEELRDLSHQSKRVPESIDSDGPCASNDSRRPSPNKKEAVSVVSTLKEGSLSPPVDKRPDSPGLVLTKQSKPEAMISQTVTSSKTVETELFLAHFYDGGEDEASPPAVIDSFSCAYWPKEGEGFISPLLHGRLFVTPSALYFIGWGDKKIVLKWEDVISVTKETIGMIDNALRVTYDSGVGESSYFFGSFAFRVNAFQILSQLSTVARSLKEIESDKSSDGKASLKAVPPDQILKKMDIVLKRKIKNVSVKRYYEQCWSEGTRTDADPFYVPFLEKKKNYNIKLGDWEFADDGPWFEHNWSGEKFSQKRVISFTFKRSTHLYVGPPIAGVTQTQYCRFNDDECVLGMTVEVNGIPYADTFAVEVRWVTHRLGSNDLSVEVGVFVNFKKSSMFAGKIKNGTITEAKPLYIALFEATKEACMADSPEDAEDAEDVEDAEEEEEMVKEEIENPKPEHYFISIFSKLSKLMCWSNIFNALVSWKDFSLSLMENPGAWPFLLAMSLFLTITLILSLSKHGQIAGSGISQVQLNILEKRMDDLNNDMEEVKLLLQDILKAVKNST